MNGQGADPHGQALPRTANGRRYRVAVVPHWDFAAWRTGARAALAAQVPPEAIDWGDAGGGLFEADALPAPRSDAAALRVPRDFPALATRVLAHRDPQAAALLYRLVWRINHGEPALLERASDADVHRVMALDQEVRRDLHKMKAFVRFRETAPGSDDFISWFEPAQHIVDLAAPFFMKRFAGMRWSILTPYRSVAWHDGTLVFGGGASPDDAPGDDAGEDLWRTYYANIFNPARLNPRMMRQEMPQKYWKHLPEAHLLPDLLRDAGKRVHDMAAREPEAPRKRIAAPDLAVAVPGEGIAGLRAAAAGCRECPLWAPATQTVFGEGPARARIVVVGEQPGDQEDLAGRPFVGPAGKLLDRALEEVGLDRRDLYLTNAVKHFKFEQRGKTRLHKSAAVAEQNACRHWLLSELASIEPEAILCLGATAAHAVLGRQFRLMANRGTWQVREDGMRALATVHPSWVLRQVGSEEKEAAYRGFVDDLRLLVA